MDTRSKTAEILKTMIKLKKSELIGIISAAAVIIVSLGLLKFSSLIDIKAFYFILGISFIIGGFPFFVDLLFESRRETEIEQMFLEFSRDLVEGVESGTPISKSISNLRTKNYGSLNPYIAKLSNQIEMGIPLKDAFEIFSKDIKSPVINRAVTLIKEAERSGGQIEKILESVTFSLSQIEVLKKERRAAISNLVVQGYIIFLIFIVIMLVMQFKILPITTQLGISGGAESLQGGQMKASSLDVEQVSRSFLYLIITQGFFIGLIIGKITEGSIRAGLKHSFVLVALSWIISSGANVFLA